MSATFTEILKKFWEWLKEPEKYLPPIAIATSIVLFYPDGIPDPIYISKLRNKFQPEFSAAFILSTSAIIWRIVLVVTSYIRQRYDHHRWLVLGKRHLHELTPEEKRILSAYIERQTIAINLNPCDGVVAELVNHRIIRAVATVGSPISWSYNIQPWAMDYLNQHCELLVTHGRKHP